MSGPRRLSAERERQIREMSQGQGQWQGKHAIGELLVEIRALRQTIVDLKTERDRAVTALRMYRAQLIEADRAAAEEGNL